MDNSKAISALKAIVADERSKGCPMAHESLIEPSLRRWKSFDRRMKQSKDKRRKDKSLTHRSQDLEKGLIEWCVSQPGEGYVSACIEHLAHSFAEVLFKDGEGEETLLDE
jgi:hypothetical protein